MIGVGEREKRTEAGGQEGDTPFYAFQRPGTKTKKKRNKKEQCNSKALCKQSARRQDITVMADPRYDKSGKNMGGSS